MKFVLNHYQYPGVDKPRQELDVDRMYIEAPDGRCAYAITLSSDGQSIEVRGVDTHKVAGILFTERLIVKPSCSNVVEISTLPWGK